MVSSKADMINAFNAGSEKSEAEAMLQEELVLTELV